MSVIICNIRELKPSAPNTVSFAIVRSMKRQINNVQQLDVLSPSWDLFSTYCDMKRAGQWDNNAFQNIYVPRFLTEIRNNKAAHDALTDIWRHSKSGQTVMLGCFCQDERFCHRSIVAGLLAGVGTDVITATGNNYAYYFDMYKRLPRPDFAK